MSERKMAYFWQEMTGMKKGFEQKSLQLTLYYNIGHISVVLLDLELLCLGINNFLASSSFLNLFPTSSLSSSVSSLDSLANIFNFTSFSVFLFRNSLH